MPRAQELISLRTFLSDSSTSVVTDRRRLTKDSGHLVSSYQDLMAKVMELAFYNENQVFLFKGRALGARSESDSLALKPSLFHPLKDRLATSRLVRRMLALSDAELKFFDLYKQAGLPGREELARTKLKRWALLEHFKVCRTPLLEVSHSLRVATSLATQTANSTGMVYVLGVPCLDGGTTFVRSGELQMLSMASIYPPPNHDVMAAHGYMLSEFSNISSFDVARFASDFDSNFSNRVVGKFKLTSDFWLNASPAYTPLEFPRNEGVLEQIAREVKATVPANI
jgi:hypothetical protein